MRAVVMSFILAGVAATSAAAQDRDVYRRGSQGIPPGHLPPPGECRVWYDNRPAGQQPSPTSCRDAERIAARDRYARVIYGRDRVRDEHGRAVPGRNDRYPDRYPSPERYPNRYPYPDDRSSYPGRYPDERGRYGSSSVPFDNGYKDGYAKGREDARDRDAYDPRRHRDYRSADRGYDRRYGTKNEYKNVYREGFTAGYEDGYRENGVYGPDPRGTRWRFPWPF